MTIEVSQENLIKLIVLANNMAAELYYLNSEIADRYLKQLKKWKPN
jgi:hypothetical protein